jgi:tetratricopeptide (TPR) repeat protein
VRNADYNHDPRGWRHRPSPEGLPRSRGTGCRALPSNSPRPGHSRRCITHACRRSVRAGAPQSSRRGFVSHPSCLIDVPTVPDPAGLLTTLVNAAQEHFSASHYAAANAFLQLIRQPDTQPAATWQQLGHLHFALAEYDAAGRAYGYAAAYAPRDASLQVRLAHTCLLLNDIPSFEGYLRRALALDSESAPALQLLADLNRDEGLYAAAAGYYDRIIQATPKGGPKRRLEDLSARGGDSLSPQSQSYSAADKLSSPRSAELAAPQVPPGQYENLLSLALCHSHLGAQDAALDCLQRAGEIARGHLSPSSC